MATKRELQQALDNLWIRYGNTLNMLNDALDKLDKKPKEVIKEVQVEVEKVVEVPVEKIVEKIVEVPVEKIVEKIVEVENTDKIQELAAEVESLLEQIEELKNNNQKTKEEETRQKIGFWATPMYGDDRSKNQNKTYTTKPRNR